MDEVAVWQEAQQPEQIREEHQLKMDDVPTNELVAHWDAMISVLNGTSGYASKTGPVFA